MPIRDMTDAELWQEICDCGEAIEAIAKYQKFLETGGGLPTAQVARMSLMDSNLSMIEQFQSKIESYRAELTRRLRESDDEFPGR